MMTFGLKTGLYSFGLWRYVRVVDPFACLAGRSVIRCGINF